MVAKAPSRSAWGLACRPAAASPRPEAWPREQQDEGTEGAATTWDGLSTPMSRSTSSTDASILLHQASDAGFSRQTVVWCHERCHKTELAEFRDDLAQEVESVGSRLYCLKKSFGFQRWAQRTKSPFFVLLADWREVKPSVEFLVQAAFDQPHLIALYTENEKQYKQALRWVSWLPANGYQRGVRVLPPTLVGKELARQVAHLLQEGALEWHSRHSSPAIISSRDWSAAEPQPLGAIPVFFLVPCAGEALPNMEQSFVGEQGDAWLSPVTEVVASIFPFATRGEIKEALTSAEPEQYEE